MSLAASIIIKPLRLIQAHSFANLRKDIEDETDYLLAKRGERKENALHVIAKTLLSQRRTITFIAYDKKMMVGYVSLVFPKYKRLSGNAYLTIALREKYRGQGIGAMLMNTAENYAATHNVRRIELEVFAKNKHAIDLYTEREYLVEGIKKEAVAFETGFDDIVIMAKKIKHS